MESSAIQVRYNPQTYRWEVWLPGHDLPAATHPSKDEAIKLAIFTSQDGDLAQLIVYSDRHTPEMRVRVERLSGSRV